MMCYSNYQPADISRAADIWAVLTDGYSYHQVDKALRAFMKTDASGFAPSPGQIIDRIYRLDSRQRLNGMEAWGAVLEALKTVDESGSAGRVFSELPKSIQKSIGCYLQFLEWANCPSFNREQARMNFLKCYSEEIENEIEYAKLNPGSLIEKCCKTMESQRQEA